MSGPYFPGQHPSPCGHYYPDVLRLRDEKRDDGTIVRVINCTYCGTFEEELDSHILHRDIVRKLDREGVIVGIKEEDVASTRRKAFKRLREK